MKIYCLFFLHFHRIGLFYVTAMLFSERYFKGRPVGISWVQ
uniref:Uncharacterized protein n=1 Tax=Anguilla anguilla TaxID=7936 RepID=A0A0E9RA70_ANGAN